jgi:hypothetical protein
MMLSAVFLVSVSTLAFEVLLTRFFSIRQWNHLSFMVISIALFGFAASGTFLSILDARKKDWEGFFSTRISVIYIVLLYTTATLLSFITLNKIPLDYFRLPLEPIQSIYLLVAYILLALPFFFSGLIISLAYALVPEKTGFVYFASMAGSACGAALPAFAIPFFGEEKLIILATLLPLMLIPASSIIRFTRHKSAIKDQHLMAPFIVLYSLAIIGFASFLMTKNGFFIIRVDPSPYKALSQVLQFPKTQIEKTATSIRGRTQKVKTAYIRFAPGLSLKYTDNLPRQTASFRDGDNQFVLYDIRLANEARFAKFTLSYCGYILVPNTKKVLLIENGGGLAIACAIAADAHQVQIVVQNPQLARIIHNHYRFPVVGYNPRSFLARTNDRFNIIHVENWGTSIPGSDALNQDDLFTKNAFAEYLNHLTPNGVIILSRKLLLPPADSIRMWAQAYEGLKMSRIKNPPAHMAMLRNWDTYTLIVSAKPLQDTTTIKQFATDLNFDLVFLPNIQPEMVNKHNIFDKPYHFLEISSLAKAYTEGKENDYFKAYLIDARPQSDMRPFPGRFLKWPKLKVLYKSMGSRFYALFMSGEVVVSVVFIEAIVVAVFLLFFPIFVFLRGSRKPSISQVIYFLGVGAGFMFVELFFIKRYVLIFGDPVISFTVVLSAILIFSSIGGLWIQRKKNAGIRNSLIVLIVSLLATIFCIEWIVDHILGFSVIWQYTSAFLLLLPVGFFMGLPFPLGMRYLLKNPAQRAYAWSVNGCASVLTSIGAAQIALSFGIPYIMGAAIIGYALALASLGKRR